jgi:hypothetical protein
MTYYKDKKPDFENESLRAWKPDKDEQKRLKEDMKDEYEVDIGDDFKVKLGGFTTCMKDDKVIFLYKFKHNEKMILYYIPDETNTLIKRDFLDSMEQFTSIMPYELKDIRDVLKVMKSEQHVFDKMTDEDNKNGK